MSAPSPTSIMPQPDDKTLAAYRDATATALGVPLDDITRPGVTQHLTVAFKMAALVKAAPLGDHADPAPVFEA